MTAVLFERHYFLKTTSSVLPQASAPANFWTLKKAGANESASTLKGNHIALLSFLGFLQSDKNIPHISNNCLIHGVD